MNSRREQFTVRFHIQKLIQMSLSKMQIVKMRHRRIIIADYCTVRFCFCVDFYFRLKLFKLCDFSDVNDRCCVFQSGANPKKSGGLELCAVPAAWEHNGVLKWPNKSTQKITKIISDPLSIPESNWNNIRCEVKRADFATYMEAENEVAIMMANSDTADSSSNELESTMKKMLPPPAAKSRKRSCVLKMHSENADSERTNHNDEMSSPPAVSSTLLLKFWKYLCIYLLISQFSPFNRSNIKNRDQQ